MQSAAERQLPTTGTPTCWPTRKARTMGRDNVDRVLLTDRPDDMPYAAWYCLLLMARAASDKEQRYWAGHGWLVLGMGYTQVGDNGFRKVRRHIRMLEKAGYISKVSGHRGARTCYQLHLPGLLSAPVDNSGDEG